MTTAKRRPKRGPHASGKRTPAAIAAHPSRSVSMPREVWVELDALAERWGLRRSETVVRLVREAGARGE